VGDIGDLKSVQQCVPAERAGKAHRRRKATGTTAEVTWLSPPDVHEGGVFRKSNAASENAGKPRARFGPGIA